MERAEAMIADTRGRARSGRLRPTAQAALAAIMAAAAGIMLSADTAPIRLVGVSAQGNALVIEAAEPVAYSVSRPDVRTLLIEMRNVSVADARNEVGRHGPIAGVELEQATAVDGRAVARVKVSLTRAAEYRIRSARNIIRVELTPPASPRASAQPPVPMPGPVAFPAVDATSTPATTIDRVRSSSVGSTTVVSLGGNGYLGGARLTESEDPPRRLVLDFPNVTSSAPAETRIGSPLVSRVRIGLNSSSPVVTRVVMEIDPSATYSVERAGEDGRDLSVVFASGS
ncbi:MAG TPA: AMIN domain-containing protein, partial [Vicinamibacterales bacterium]|nr:AMIN domain-containing protein [Vicinamibacterales bacterium]